MQCELQGLMEGAVGRETGACWERFGRIILVDE